MFTGGNPVKKDNQHFVHRGWCSVAGSFAGCGPDRYRFATGHGLEAVERDDRRAGSRAARILDGARKTWR